MDNLVGKLIDRKYKLGSLLGEGGMGSVYEAEHTLLKRTVAVKVMHSEFSAIPEVGIRFLREAQASSAIGHPNIIQIFDVGQETDGTVYIVMERLNGQDLKELAESEETISIKRAVSIVLQILSGLAAAHQMGIIHRDIKPENVFLHVDKKGRNEVKILDFGIAKVHGEMEGNQRLTKVGTILGTPNYMSPEQARGQKVDKRIDIWAVGVILYELLSGELPYDGESYNEVLSGILLEPARPLSEVADRGLPEGLVSAVEKAMAKDPDQRYLDVSEMIRDLMPYGDMSQGGMSKQAAKGIKQSVAPPSKKSGVLRGKKRKTTAALVILTIVGVLILGGLLFFRLFPEKSSETMEVATQSLSFLKEAASDISTSDITPITIAADPKEPQKDKEDEEKVGDKNETTDNPMSDGLAAKAPTADQNSDDDSNKSKDHDGKPLVESVTINLIKLPSDDVDVFLDDKKVNLPLELKKSNKKMNLKVVVPGYSTFEKTIVPNVNLEIEVEIKKKKSQKKKSHKKRSKKKRSRKSKST